MFSRPIYVHQCALCRHLTPNEPTGRGRTCTAFPQGIPQEILQNRFDHRKPYPGDHGIRFQAEEDLESPFAACDVAPETAGNAQEL